MAAVRARFSAVSRAIEGRLNARDPHGAGRLLAPLSLLALGQNTGLHPGETKYGSEEFASSPFGGEPLKGVTELHNPLPYLYPKRLGSLP